MADANYQDLLNTVALGDANRAMVKNLYGFNHRQTPNPVPSNRDQYGLTFFVRPQLNMQRENLLNVRQMTDLLNANPMSLHRYVRCMLDPRLTVGYKLGSYSTPAVTSPLINPKQAFIPILTNNLLTMTGWPDLVNPTFTSDAGLYRESYSQVDGIYRYFSPFDVTATFRNTRGDPVPYLFYVWEFYQSLVFEGRLSPYIDMVTANRIDYNTRIYRLVLSQDKSTVTKMAATGIAFPSTFPLGSFFDFSTEKPYNEQNRDISIRFNCTGVDFNDPITVMEFNATVGIFNPDMRGTPSGQMKLIPRDMAQIFNGEGYPRIDPDTYELQWWIEADHYDRIESSYIRHLKRGTNY